MRSLLISCLTTSLFLLFDFGAAEPVQYCRFGHGHDATVDFCLGITTHYNASSDSHDMYTSIQVTRSSALGWTAIGTGSMMAGSLMFIVYGDPSSSEHKAPTVSVRTIDGHHQPHLLSEDDTGGVDVRLLAADWVPDADAGHDHPVSVARVALVCYSCGKWSGTPILADATAQPWIWAWNDAQRFDKYSTDEHLKVHDYHPGNGGWGRFYVDMARSLNRDVSAPPPPQIRPGVSALGASEIPGGWSWMDPIGYVHGLMMATAFLILFPTGVFAMRSGSKKSFQYHWILQAVASVFILVGMALGLIRAHRIDSVHHWIGLIVAACSIVQIVLGWRHHVLFVRIRRRQWASYGHIWLGRVFLLLGWSNIITGLLLTGRGWSWLVVATCFILVDVVALIGWVWFATRRGRRETRLNWEEETPLYPLDSRGDEYFAVAVDDDDPRSSDEHSETVKIRKTGTE
ncbi:hypothetical protein BJX99DRAFT_158099 [Aspergillus californicus]